jgi:hypothetical protein
LITAVFYFLFYYGDTFGGISLVSTGNRVTAIFLRENWLPHGARTIMELNPSGIGKKLMVFVVFTLHLAWRAERTEFV